MRRVRERDRDLRPLVRVAWCEIASLAIIMTGDIPLPLAVIMLTAVPAAGLASDDAGWKATAQKLSAVITILYLPFFFLDWFYLSSRLIFATVHLTFFLKLHTLLQPETRRERLRLHVLCLFEMLAAASMTVNFSFALPFALFVLSGTLVLVSEQLDAKLDRHRLRRALRASAGVTSAMLMLGTVVFFLLPRPTDGGFRLGGLTGITETGFSDEVRLGDFEEIRRSTDIVMRIVSDNGASAPRWRGPAYDRYERGEWKQTYRGIMSLRRERASLVLSPPSAEPLAHTEVFVEPLDTDVLFLPPAAARVEPNERYVFVDPYWTLRTGRRGRAGRRYTVSWRFRAPAGTSPVAPLNGVATLSERSRRHYTQVPELSESFRTLATRLVPEAGNPLEAARGVERYLESTYGYTLVQPSRVHTDPIEDFLFEARAGHCEYFATAMALILRDRGIPARLVTGFLRGQQNALGEFEVVRRLNAHAWVEVFDEERSWVAFDPTPPVAASDFLETTGFLSQGIDSIRMLWDVYVVAYDFERQRGLIGDIERGLSGLVRRAGVPLALVASAFFLLRVLAGLLGGRVRRRFGWPSWLRWPWRRRRGTVTSVGFYDQVLKRLESLGVTKPPGATAAEFAARLDGNLPGMIQLTEIYYRVRFGGEILTAIEAKRAEGLSLAVRLAATGDRPGG